MKYIIISADDFGIHLSIDKGIISLLEKNKISDLSVIANGNTFPECLKSLKAIGIDSVGAHLTLVAGEKPLTDCKIFVEERENKFVEFRSTVYSKLYLNYNEALNEIKNEFTAQIEAILAEGMTISHVDAHQHLHLLPPIANIVCDLAKSFSIPYVRVPKVKNIFSGKPPLHTSIMVNFLCFLLKEKIKNRGLNFLSFAGFEQTANLEIVEVLNGLKEYDSDIVEIMCHPGIVDESLKFEYGKWELNWSGEFESLQNLDGNYMNSEFGVSLKSFKEIGELNSIE